MTLVLPNLQEKQMGQVITTITVTNFIDLVMACLLYTSDAADE